MKMKLLKNKKADERYLFIWMIINWVIIGISIMIGVSMFYSVQADARLAEAAILSDNVLNCLAEDFSVSDISAETIDLSKCGLNKELIEKSDLYYIEIKLDLNNKNEKLIKFGNTAYDVLCKKISEEQPKNFPRCSTKSLAVQDSQTKTPYTLSVLAASNQR